MEELLSPGLQPVQDSFGKHFTWYAQECNTTVVVADGPASLFMYREQEVDFASPQALV